MADTGGRAARFLRAAALPAAAGLVASLGQPPFNAPWAALPGVAAGLALFLRTTGWRQGAFTGWAFGTGYGLLAFAWIVQPFFVDPVRHGWMSPFAILLMASGLGAFWAIALGLAALTRTPVLRLTAAVLALTLVELTRTYIFTGFPWALIGHGWIGWPAMQLAAWGGAGLLTLAMLTPAALAATRRPTGIAAGILLALALNALGYWRAGPPPADTAFTVRIVQPNVQQHLKWDQAQADTTYVDLLRLTASTPEGPPPDLIVWPETAIPYYYDGPGTMTAEIAAAAGHTVLTGVLRIDGRRAFNALIQIAPDGSVPQSYDKHHPVPFGEYIPFEPVLSKFGLSAFTAREGFGFTAGPGPRLIDLGPLGQALPLICYEVIFPQGLRTQDRPALLVNITNDAWFGTFSGPYQHLAQARLRAVEQGLPLIRAANTGVSAVIDARGTVRASLPLGQQGFLDAPLPATLPRTLYATTGDLPLALLLAALLAGTLLIRRRDSH